MIEGFDFLMDINYDHLGAFLFLCMFGIIAMVVNWWRKKGMLELDMALIELSKKKAYVWKELKDRDIK